MNWPTFTQSSPNDAYIFRSGKNDFRPVRALIVVGLLFMGGFVWVYFQSANRGYSWLFTLLTVSISFKLLRLLHEWYHYWRVRPPTPPPGYDRSSTTTGAPPQTGWTVDVLTTFCPGEPYDMLLNTLRAIQAIRYPHTTYLCDETDDPYLRQICGQMGIRHVSRTDKADAKAGNINNALRQATGDICLIIDPDHVPVPDFLDQVLPYFANPAVGFVQCVQGYYNRKESVVAYGATQQTYAFYGPMMTCMGSYGTAQAIGANCTFRRAALDAIGGHAAGLSEDMHTAMHLHATGWQSVYVPLPLSYGLVPATLSAYYKQQLKWARGTFELLVTTYPRVFRGLSRRQRFHYLTLPMHYLIGVVQLIDLLIPIVSLVLMKLPLRLDLLVFAAAYLPLLLATLLIRQYAQRWLIERHEAGFHVLGGVLSSGTWWVYVLGLVYTIFRIDVPYLPTPKADRPRNNVVLCLPNLLMALLTLLAIGYSIYHYGRYAVSNFYSQLMIGFGLLNVCILLLNVLISQEKMLIRFSQWLQRFSVRHTAVRTLRVAFWHVRFGLYGWLRQSAVPLFSGLLLLTTALAAHTYRQQTATLPPDVKQATTQSFYYGQESSARPGRLPVTPVANQFISPRHLTWSVETSARIIRPIADPVWSAHKNELPLLYVEPRFVDSLNQETGSETDLQTFLLSIQSGRCDTVLMAFGERIKQYEQPVLLSFAPAFDDPDRPWGTRQENTLTLYRQAWQYMVRFYRQQRVSNIVWVWCPAKPSTFVTQYPGADYADWLGIDIVTDPARSANGQSRSFAGSYQLIHNTIRMHTAYSIRQKPILITRFGFSTSNADEPQWIADALEIMRDRYPEIRGVVFTNRRVPQR